MITNQKGPKGLKNTITDCCDSIEVYYNGRDRIDSEPEGHINRKKT